MPATSIRPVRGVPSATVAQVLAAREPLVIDVRAPVEHAVDCFPGALCVPLFDDAERALIGTAYRHESPEAAFTRARELMRSHIDPLVRSIAARAGHALGDAAIEQRFVERTASGFDALQRELRTQPLDALPEHAVVLACWRGGMRSRSLASFLRELGLERACILEGGYRAWRAHVAAGLDALALTPPVFVLRGLTGVGKTLVLRAIERLRPEWVLDLEALAEHRSSVLGMVGLTPASQKKFESRLWRRCSRGFGAAIVLEGESRKIGDAILPTRLWTALCSGTCIELATTLDRRIDVLLDDYLEHPDSRTQLRRQLPFIEQRIGPVQWAGKLVALLDEHRERELVSVLLDLYYDPLYRHSEKAFSLSTRIDSTSPAHAARECIAFIESHLSLRSP
ncbi:MAG: tRNA 2-selenouridine(34) synthase MnmH [Planctomycetota bacterium]|nr:MAG: tRNA 2-selenouridine(34) synthase MnmH [Planctomycetota bacterium]